MRVDRNRERGFCFVEYANPVEATMAVQKMDKMVFDGVECVVSRSDKAPGNLNREHVNRQHVMKVLENPALRALINIPGMVEMLIRKPNLATTLEQQVKFAEKSAENAAADGRRKLYVGSVYLDVTAEQLRHIFEPFGTILNVNLPHDSATGKHKGFAFIEFNTEKAAEQAFLQMNDFELCGRRLKIARSSIPQLREPTSISSELNMLAGPQSTQSLIAQAKMLTTPLAGNVNANQSAVIVLKNMIHPTELDDEFEDEVRDEVVKYGVVKKILVHFDELANDKNQSVRVFVQFSNLSSGVKAKKALDQCWFAGRLVKCEYYNEEKFNNRDI